MVVSKLVIQRVYGVLKRHDLNTKEKRLQWIQRLSGVVLNISEELNVIRKRAKATTLKPLIQENLLVRDTFLPWLS
jgi:hypothetical protein